MILQQRPPEWQCLVSQDQRLAGLELAASLTAPAYDHADYWRVWTRITRQLDEIVDDHRWSYIERDVAYAHLLRAYESAADARGSVVR
jgi:hypothetical protein